MLGFANRIRLRRLASLLPKANTRFGGASAAQSVYEPRRLASHIVKRWTVEGKVEDEPATGPSFKPWNDRRFNLVQILTNYHPPRQIRCPLVSVWPSEDLECNEDDQATREEPRCHDERPASGRSSIGRCRGGIHHD
jgi:hypothetical protein